MIIVIRSPFHSPIIRLITVALSYAISLIIFQKGLLVKRQVLPGRSGCSDVLASDSENCWVQPRYNKSILLVIDALRYDFIFPQDICKYTARLPPHNKFYHGHLKKVAQLMREQPENTALFPFIADAPTTTYQRIKALVTGSVPAFIEAGDNFDGATIGEDNIIDQLIALGKNATLLGDETWLQLLPGRFHRQFDKPSFDIKDLDTVDNAVIENIFDEIARPDWTLIIAHCLGVDHAGHRYAPSHMEMTRKLLQMDQLIWNLTQQLPEDAILFVFGDHGMTETGDHGGDSRKEVRSALFAYTRKKGGMAFASEFNCTRGQDKYGPVQQVDLVPTLAMLLGFPIPYSNIGKLILPIFGQNPHDASQEVRFNAFQMFRYANEYSKQRSELREPFEKIAREYENRPSEDILFSQKAIHALNSLIRSSLDQFHFELCLVGILSFFDALLLNILMVSESRKGAISPISLTVFRSALLLLQVSLLFGERPSSYQMAFTNLSLILSLCYILPALFFSMGLNICFESLQTYHRILEGYWPIIGQILFALGAFSDSFVINEADILRFLLLFNVVRAAVLPYLELDYNGNSPLRIVRIRQTPLPEATPENFSQNVTMLFIALIFLKPLESCREEQVRCLTFMKKEQRFTMAIVGVYLFAIIMLRKFWRDVSNITKLFLWPMIVMLSFHWILDSGAGEMRGKSTQQEIFKDTTRTLPSSITETIESLEYASQWMARIIFSAFLAHFFAFKFLSGERSVTQCMRSNFYTLSVLVLMLIGPTIGWNASLALLLFPAGDQLFENDPNYFSWFMSCLGAYFFYATGYHRTLTFIPWRAAFVGIPGNFPYKWLPAAFILTAMFSGQLLSALVVQAKDASGVKWNGLFLMFFLAVKVFFSMLAALLHHKHLMFYKVFAPKFVFDAVELLICIAFNFSIYLLMKLNMRKKRSA